MTEDKLGKALEAAASDAAVPDAVDQGFTDEVWRRGLIKRRRRQAGMTVGGGLGLAAAAAAVIALGGFGEQTSFTPPDPAEQTFTQDVEPEEIDDTLADSTATDLPTPTQGPTAPEQPTATDSPTQTDATSNEPAVTTPPAVTQSTAPETTNAAPTNAEPTDAEPTDAEPTPRDPSVAAPAPPEPTSAEPTATETTADVSCSADNVGAGAVRFGDAPQAARSKAGVLARAARGCDEDTLVALGIQDETSLSFGLVSPADVFALPENRDQRYGTLLRLLTERDPEYNPPTVDSVTGETTLEAFWVWGDFGPNWRVGIGESGRWMYFIAGD